MDLSTELNDYTKLILVPMSQDLQFDGKKYISSKRAAQSCAYTQDYIGQLIRGNKIDARMVGRAWFVSEESVLSYKKQIDLSGTNQVSVPPTLQYLTDPRPLLPELKKLAPKPVVSESVSQVAQTSQKTLGDIVRTVISTHDIGKKMSAAILSLSIIFTTATVGGLYTSTNIQQSAHASLATIAEGVYDSFVSLLKNDIGPAFSRIASVVGSGFGSTLDTAKTSSVVSIVNEKPSAQIVKNYITNTTAGVSAKDVALAMALIKEDLQDQIGSLQNASAINLRNIRSSSERDRTSVINNSTISNSTLKNPSITGASISGSSISNSSVAATSLTAAWADITNAVLSESVVSNGTTTNATSTNLYSDLVTVSGTISLQSATPIVTANKLYAQGTDLYWAGNVVSGASTASWASDGTHAWRATGNVGIGTTTPAEKFSVQGNALFSGNIFAADMTATGTISFFNALGTNATTTHLFTTVASSTNLFSSLLTVGGDTLVTTAMGGVGIGTTNPGDTLMVRPAIGSGIAGLTVQTLGSGTDESAISVKHPNVNGYGWRAKATNTEGSFQLDVQSNGSWTNNALFVKATNGNVGIGTTNPTNKVTIASLSGSDDTLPALGVNGGKFGILNNVNSNPYGLIMGVLGTGDAFQQVQNVGGSATFYNLLLQPNGGNVGIGTTTPFTTLSVAGSAYIGGNLTATGTATFLGNVNTTGTETAGNFVASNASATSTFAGGLSVGTSKLLVDRSTGFVGIGTTSPISLLHVNSSTADAKIRVESNAGNTLDFRSELGNQAGTFMGQNRAGATQIFASNAPLIIGTFTANDLIFGTNNTTNLTVKSGGNVGIGTTTPAKALEINSATGSNLRLTYNNTDKNADFSMQNDGGLNINLNYGPLKITNDRNGLQSVMLASDIYIPVNGLATVSAGKIALNSVPFGANEGSLGFNTYMTAGQSYALISGSKGFVLRQGEGAGSTDGSLYFESLVSGIRNTRFVLDPGGNVGVGSTTPWAQLSVNPNGVTGPSFVVGSSTKTDFIVTNEGFVGIGSTNPKHVFQIGSGTTGSYDDGRSILTGGGGQQDTTPKAIITATISNTSGSIKSIGLDLHNDDIGTDGLRSPALTFSDRSNTTYTSVLAGIDAVDLGQGRDANWRAGGLAFHTMSMGMGGNLERVRIDANGNMGINTIAPTEKLQVNGNVRTLGNVRVESTIGSNLDTKFDLNATYYDGSNNYSSAGLEVKGTKDFGTVDSIQGALRFFAGADTAATTGWALRSDALLSTTTLSGSGAQFVLNKSGNVGVGTTSPVAKLSIKGAGLTTGKALAITNSSDVEKVTILDNGEVTLTTNAGSGGTPLMFVDTSAGNKYMWFEPFDRSINVFETGQYGTKFRITGGGFDLIDTGAGLGTLFSVGPGSLHTQVISSADVLNTHYGQLRLTSNYWGISDVSPAINFTTFDSAGTTDQFAKLQIYNGNDGKILINPSGGNVGIGTTTPTNKLSVISPDGGPLFYSGNTSNYLSMSLGRTANDAVVCIAEGVNRCVIGAAAGDMVIRSENHKIILNADGGSSMNLVASGSYLGIGTNNPVSTLHINSGSNVTSAIRITSNNNANAADIGVAGSNGAIFTNALTGDLAVRFNSGNNLIFGDSGPTELMRITSSGSVGIGTSTPQSKLHVDSSSSDSRISVSAGSGAVMTQLIANTSTNTGYVGTANNFPFVIRVNDTNAGTFDTSGTFTLNGLGSNPRLNFGGGSLGVINRGGSGGTAYDLYIGETADTGKLIMRGSGFTTIESSVGVGTLTPLSKLDVQTATNKHLQVTTASGSLSGISLYAGTDADAYNALQLDGSSLLLNTRSGGNVGIGTTTPNYKLTVNGGIAITRHSSTDSVDHSVAFTTTDDVSTLTPQFSIGDYNGTYGSTTTIDFNLGFDHAGMRLWSPNASLYLGNDISSNGAGPNVGVTPGFYGQSFSVWENSTGSNYPTIKAGVLQMVGDEVGMKAQGNWLGMADLSNNYVWSFNNDVADGTIDGIPSDNKLRVHKDLIALTKFGVATSSPASTFTVGSGGACFSGGTGSTVACGNTGGNLYYRTANTGTYDVAENYMTSDDTIVAGDIVALDTLTASTITKATTGSHILGIVSTDPGLLLGGADGNNNGSTTRPVALSGRVPVKVNGENGNIAIGDKISLSSVSGVGRKSKGSEEAVGVALESWTGGVGDTGTVMVFVSTKQYFDQEKFSIDQNGNVGIGTTTPTYKLQIMGDIAATSFVNISTRDAKHDITYLDGTQKASILDRIKTIGIAQYRYNTESESNPLRLGLIAEEAPTEILAVGGKGVDVYKLSTFILAGVQEMQSTIEKMNLSVEDLKARMTTVEGRLASLEQFIEMGGLSQMNAADTASTTRGTVHSFLASAGIAIDALSSKITSIATDAVSANFVVVNQTLKVQSVQAESISSSELRVGTSTNPSQSGITIIDRGTGQPYCMFILNGVMQNQAGDCATQIAPNSNEQSSHNTSGSVYGGGNTSGTSGTTTESVNDTGTSTPDGGVSSEGSTTGGENTGEVISESGTGSDGGTPSGGESVPVVETPPEAPVENPVP